MAVAVIIFLLLILAAAVAAPILGAILAAICFVAAVVWFAWLMMDPAFWIALAGTIGLLAIVIPILWMQDKKNQKRRDERRAFLMEKYAIKKVKDGYRLGPKTFVMLDGALRLAEQCENDPGAEFIGADRIPKNLLIRQQ